jgi:2-polyprenyl-6-hydroxyphenyl methylase/3-demethylubiquinone-9 3-methyltransferase
MLDEMEKRRRLDMQVKFKAPQQAFAFGKNWASYSRLIDARAIEEAEKGLLRLIPREAIAGRSFLDIGCGSGLHALAAARLGAGAIVAIDIDPDSVATTNAVLSSNDTGVTWSAREQSVFDLEARTTFDIVYSWGVLHHTGDMWKAIDRAASVVAPNGLFIFALYRTTRSDAFWKREKRWYARASTPAQAVARWCFIAAYRLAYLGQFRDYVANYKSMRGMDFHHNVHDWLGGYPYETTLAPEVEARMRSLGFRAERVFAQGKTRGLLAPAATNISTGASGTDDWRLSTGCANPLPLWAW